MNTTLTILPSYSIDAKKWDACIRNNANGLIYSTTDYLTALSENWHGLVVNDYETILPLPWKKKAGIRYGYTPPFIQQLGISGNSSPEIVEKIINTIYAFIRYGDVHFNFSNTAIADRLQVTQRTNFLIDFAKGYSKIRVAYQQDVVENIRKAETAKLNYSKGSGEEAIALYQRLYAKKIPGIEKTAYSRLSALCKGLEPQGRCISRVVADDSGNLLSSALFFIDEKRIYNIANAVTKEGRGKEANYFLFDQVFREFAGTDLLFDFEGSDLPGVKQFYQKFGGVDQPYFHYHHNRLPLLLRFLKR